MKIISQTSYHSKGIPIHFFSFTKINEKRTRWGINEWYDLKGCKTISATFRRDISHGIVIKFQY